MTGTPVWIRRESLLALHERSISRHGGIRGIRDVGLLESALARPENKWSYEPETSVYRLAAAYCFGIVKNHPFLDGNKRAGFSAMNLFLRLNGVRLVADATSAELAVIEVASSQMNEDELAAWLQRYSV